ncbi:hypothetical protein ACA910_013553 [Epithemia clementina (nom. ined.)]
MDLLSRFEQEGGKKPFTCFIKYVFSGLALFAMTRVHIGIVSTIWRSQYRWQQSNVNQKSSSSSVFVKTIIESSDSLFENDTSKGEGLLYESNNTTMVTMVNASARSSSPGEASIQSNMTSSSPSSKFAYVFLIGGCNPQQPSGYRGFVYNVLVATRMLRQRGAQADIVALFQISQKSSDTELPEQDARPLEALGVKVRYLTKETGIEDYYQLQFRKFDVLALTEYRRVLFLDGDIMPLGNLDYFFQLSGGGEDGEHASAMLKENVMIAGPLAPANGGFFLITPSAGRLEQVQDILDRRRSGFVDGKPHFDIVQGWGHAIEPPDKWVARNGEGRNWTFYAASGDQGLLFYYLKYVLQDVSIIVGERHGVQNWVKANQTSYQQNNTTSPCLESTLPYHTVFGNHSNPILHHKMSCDQFMCDFVHFYQKRKPWLRKATFPKRVRKPFELWWKTLQTISTELSMGLNFTHNWKRLDIPTLGFQPQRVG